MHGSKTEQRVCAPYIKRSSRHLTSPAAPHLTSTFHTLSLFSSSSSTPSETTTTCANPRAQQSGALAGHPTFTLQVLRNARTAQKPAVCIAPCLPVVFCVLSPVSDLFVVTSSPVVLAQSTHSPFLSGWSLMAMDVFGHLDHAHLFGSRCSLS